MPRREIFGRQVGTGPMRNFEVTFLDDSPERAEAIGFFSNLRRPILSAHCLPDEINDLSQADAQAYLDAHPVQQKWSLLRVLTEDHVSDDDLARLQFIPELKHLLLYDVGNDAIKYAAHCTQLEELIVYSKKVTDACLIHIPPLTSLRIIDFQGSPNISPSAFAEVVDSLPDVVDVYPPYRGTE